MITPTKSGDRTNSKWYFNATHTPKRSAPSSDKAWGDESSVRACHWGTLRCPWIWPTANQTMETYWVCLNIGYVIFQFQWIILRQKSSFSLVKWLCRGIIYIYICIYPIFVRGCGVPSCPRYGMTTGLCCVMLLHSTSGEDSIHHWPRTYQASPSPLGLPRLLPTNVRKVGVGSSWLWVPWGWCKTRLLAIASSYPNFPKGRMAFWYSNDHKHCPSVNIRDSCNQMLTAMALFGAVLPNFIAGNVLFCRWNLLASCEKRTSLFSDAESFRGTAVNSANSECRPISVSGKHGSPKVPRFEQCFAKAKQQRFLGLQLWSFIGYNWL